MQRALSLARRGEGLTRPNPPVGAVVVRNGTFVGEGWHHKAGGPHAEVFALRQAVGKANGSTLYVTLEPCSTFGRTPPCVEAILAAGVARVVVGSMDPNPRHKGRGLRLLRSRGVEVDTGLCREQAEALIAPFSTHMRLHRPYYHLKLGLSLDGRIADSTHSSRWITGPKARNLVQAMRRSADAILVGAGTVRHDNPSLWPRPDRKRNPWRVIVTRSGRLPLSAQVFTDAHAERTLVAAPKGWHPHSATALRKKGVGVLELSTRRFWADLSTELAERDVLKVFCEGGGELAGALLKAGRVDELSLFSSPMFIGGPVGAVGGRTWPLAQAPRFRLQDVQPVGKDLLLHLFPVQTKEE